MAATTDNRGPGDIELETTRNTSYEFPQPDGELLACTDTDSSKPLLEPVYDGVEDAVGDWKVI